MAWDCRLALLGLGENQIAPTAPQTHGAEARLAFPATLAQHEDTDVPVGIAALLTEDDERILPLGVGVFRGVLDALVGHHRLHRRNHGTQIGDRLLVRPVAADVHRNDALGGDECVGSGEALIGDVRVDVAVAIELLHEHRDAAGNRHLAIQHGPNAADGGDGLRTGVSEKVGDT
jgi:hypothetical protein